MNFSKHGQVEFVGLSRLSDSSILFNFQYYKGNRKFEFRFYFDKTSNKYIAGQYPKIHSNYVAKIMHEFQEKMSSTFIYETKDTIMYIKNHKFHNEGGPAYVTYHQDGTLCSAEYYINDICHRVGGPAIVKYVNGNLIMQAYYLNGVLHNTDGPALIKNSSHNLPETIQYSVNGKHHREDGPALVHYTARFTNANGVVNQLRSECYYKHGILHRVDGPAEISYHYSGGGRELESYYQEGKLHRVNGPAVIYYNRITKLAEKEMFHINGELIKINEYNAGIVHTKTYSKSNF